MSSTRLVIDADVGRAASEHSTDSSARSCAELLRWVESDRRYDIAVSPELRREIDDHWIHSRFARKWLVLMTSRGRVAEVTPERYQPLRDAYAQLDPAIVDIVDKDAHLVDLAFATDRRVISGDVRTRDHLATTVSTYCRQICTVHWVRPDSEAIAWLARGSPAAELRLCDASDA